MTETSRVHIIDDDDAMRGSLEFLLGSAAFATKAFERADHFLNALYTSEVGPDCVITDVRMPGIDGIELLRRLRGNGHEVPVIVMTGHGDLLVAIEAMKNGAFDFLEKPFSDDQLFSSVEVAVNHRRGSDVRDREREDLAAAIERLTARERQVLDWLIDGIPNVAIADDLGIALQTVEIFRANVMTKLGASSLSDVIRKAYVARGRRTAPRDAPRR